MFCTVHWDYLFSSIVALFLFNHNRLSFYDKPVFLVLEVSGVSGCTHQDGPLQVGVDAAEHELAHDGGDGGEDQSATQDPCGRHVVCQGAGLGRDTRNWAANPCRDSGRLSTHEGTRKVHVLDCQQLNQHKDKRGSGSAELLTWEDTIEDLQFVGVLPPQTQDVVLPADHLAEDQHDGDCRQADEQEQRVGTLHHIQPLLVAHHLEGRRDRQSGGLQQRSETSQRLLTGQCCKAKAPTCMTVTAP